MSTRKFWTTCRVDHSRLAELEPLAPSDCKIRVWNTSELVYRRPAFYINVIDRNSSGPSQKFTGLHCAYHALLSTCSVSLPKRNMRKEVPTHAEESSQAGYRNTTTSSPATTTTSTNLQFAGLPNQKWGAEHVLGMWAMGQRKESPSPGSEDHSLSAFSIYTRLGLRQGAFVFGFQCTS